MGKPMNKSAKGANKSVMKNNDKPKPSEPREPKMIEKRMDPSDGNGPFTHASFLRFHGEEKGQQLWDEGADSSTMVEAKKKGKGKGKKGKKPAPEQIQKKPVQKNEPQPKTQQTQKAGKGKKQEEKTGGKDAKKGKGKGKNTQKGGAEKRLDPSDGNGPFTKASFIRFHGEDKGLSLWNQAGPMKKDNTSNPFN